MKHNLDGAQAETKVAEFLEKSGFKIIERNWKTPQCEIDIVAEKDNCMYFVEVKFRSKPGQGDGFEYITQKKLDQMRFASELWVAKHRYSGEYCLSGASVSGPYFKIEFIEEIF